MNKLDRKGLYSFLKESVFNKVKKTKMDSNDIDNEIIDYYQMLVDFFRKCYDEKIWVRNGHERGVKFSKVGDFADVWISYPELFSIKLKSDGDVYSIKSIYCYLSDNNDIIIEVYGWRSGINFNTLDKNKQKEIYELVTKVYNQSFKNQDSITSDEMKGDVYIEL